MTSFGGATAIALWLGYGWWLVSLGRTLRDRDVGSLGDRVRPQYRRAIGLAMVGAFVSPLIGVVLLDGRYALPVMSGIAAEFAAFVVWVARRHVRAATRS